MKILRYKEITSTQDEARRLAEKAEEWTVVVAESQTKGRGKPGSSWFSPAGGLYFSVILKPRKNPSELTPLTRVAALAISRAIKDFDPQIKLPNDILIGGKKVCGILTEKAGENVIIGVGLNLNIAKFPPELNAVSLNLDKETICSAILVNLKEEYLKYLGIKV